MSNSQTIANLEKQVQNENLALREISTQLENAIETDDQNRINFVNVNSEIQGRITELKHINGNIYPGITLENISYTVFNDEYDIIVKLDSTQLVEGAKIADGNEFFSDTNKYSRSSNPQIYDGYISFDDTNISSTTTSNEKTLNATMRGETTPTEEQATTYKEYLEEQLLYMQYYNTVYDSDANTRLAQLQTILGYTDDYLNLIIDATTYKSYLLTRDGQLSSTRETALKLFLTTDTYSLYNEREDLIEIRIHRDAGTLTDVYRYIDPQRLVNNRKAIIEQNLTLLESKTERHKIVLFKHGKVYSYAYIPRETHTMSNGDHVYIANAKGDEEDVQIRRIIEAHENIGFKLNITTKTIEENEAEVYKVELRKKPSLELYSSNSFLYKNL